jgi:hypothetical protein
MRTVFTTTFELDSGSNHPTLDDIMNAMDHAFETQGWSIRSARLSRADSSFSLIMELGDQPLPTQPTSPEETAAQLAHVRRVLTGMSIGDHATVLNRTVKRESQKRWTLGLTRGSSIDIAQMLVTGGRL